MRRAGDLSAASSWQPPSSRSTWWAARSGWSRAFAFILCIWIGLGLLAAAAAGLSAWGCHLPFLTALTAHVHLPLIGDLHLSSVLLFDLGVYLLVVGATLLILVALAHQSLRRPRKTVTPVSADLEETETHHVESR